MFPDVAFGGQDGHVLVGGAAGAAQVGEAEAVDPAVRVGIPAAGLDGVGVGVGTPLHHAERDVRPWELAHGARVHRPGSGAVERMDEGCRVWKGGGRRRLCAGPLGRRTEEHRAQHCQCNNGNHRSSAEEASAGHRADGSRPGGGRASATPSAWRSRRWDRRPRLVRDHSPLRTSILSEQTKDVVLDRKEASLGGPRKTTPADRQLKQRNSRREERLALEPSRRSDAT